MDYVSPLTSVSVDDYIYMPRVVLATIPNGASVSNAIDSQRGIRSFLGVQMPAGWTAASITFEVSHDSTTWSQLYAPGFGVVTVAAADGAAADLAFSLNPAFFAGWSFVRVRSGTTAAPVTQDAERVLRVLTRAV
jgi:hypothetical protein